jgi:hypothetical protein
MERDDGRPDARLRAAAGRRAGDAEVSDVRDSRDVPAEAGRERPPAPAVPSADTVVNYHFPVEVVVVGGLSDEERDALEAHIWERLSRALDRLS